MIGSRARLAGIFIVSFEMLVPRLLRPRLDTASAFQRAAGPHNPQPKWLGLDFDGLGDCEGDQHSFLCSISGPCGTWCKRAPNALSHP